MRACEPRPCWIETNPPEVAGDLLRDASGAPLVSARTCRENDPMACLQKKTFGKREDMVTSSTPVVLNVCKVGRYLVYTLGTHLLVTKLEPIYLLRILFCLGFSPRPLARRRHG